MRSPTKEEIVTVCMYCKQVRQVSGVWTEMSAAEAASQFQSHGICENCFEIRFPEEDENNTQNEVTL